jgi:hypothetical protein
MSHDKHLPHNKTHGRHRGKAAGLQQHHLLLAAVLSPWSCCHSWQSSCVCYITYVLT